MKSEINYCLRVLLMAGCLVTPPLALSACADDEIKRPEVTSPVMPDLGPEATEGTISLSQMETYTPFTAGTGAHSYRIPAMVTAADGSLLVFCEARYNSWMDKSYTDIVVRRSTDNGKTWSEQTNLTGSANGGGYAFMDPTPVADRTTGRIFVFCCRWVKSDADATKTRAYMISSSDNGATWSDPADVTDQVIVPGCFSSGFGPGSGVQISRGRRAGRLILPSRQYNGSASKGFAVYSDDHGATWKVSSEVLGGESQIAECGEDRLTVNIRKGADRYSSFSKDGGQTWTAAAKDGGLPSFESGCHASVCSGGGNMVFYCGPKGGAKSSTHDNRYELMLYRSPTGAQGWTRSQLLYDLAAGYPDMTLLGDGRLAIVFEAGPEKGFITRSSRPAGWMRLDVLILPREVADYGYWFE